GFPSPDLLIADARGSTALRAFSGLGASVGIGVMGTSGNPTVPALPIGVLGAALSGASGVVGLTGAGAVPAGYFAGVLGAAPAGTQAVVGVAGGVGPLSPAGTVAVGGYSADGIGAVGTSNSNHGVFGLTAAPAGTVQGGLLAAGCVGRTTSTVALYGYAS